MTVQKNLPKKLKKQLHKKSKHECTMNVIAYSLDIK